jgi:cyclic beta-1,2-glucan synthetase
MKEVAEMRMRSRGNPTLLFLFLTIFAVGFFVFRTTHSAGSAPLSESEKSYLLSVYRGTWNYLGTFVEKQTGLPYDSNARQPATSLSNVGLYLASTAIAYRTGLILKQEADERIEKCLESLEKIETWRGFPRPWILVRTLKPTYGEEFSYGPHIANLLGGLIVTKASYPEGSARIRRLIQKMELKSLYEKRNGWLKGGYNVKKKDFAVFQPWGHWYYKYFASETRLLSFYAIAAGAVPKAHWFSLIRPSQKKEGETFFISGYEEGGLITQFLSGIFLDERRTEMGDSQRSYARYQMKYAKKIKAPVWGWSASESPQGRYLAHGELLEDIVAPYASVLAAIYFPKEAVQNLKKLEELGVRPAAKEVGRSMDFGFRDSVNWKAGEISKHYLTLDQAMIFLSLANLLYEGIVWRSFGEDPSAQKGYEILSWPSRAFAA